MKKLFAMVLFAAIIGAAAFAQDSGTNWYDSYAEGIDRNFFVNAGVGIGTSTQKIAVPPVSVSVDYKLPVELPITVGGIAVFSMSTTSHNGSGSSAIDVTYTDIGLGARGAYHFNAQVKNLDTYAGLTLGWVIQSTSVKYGSYWDNNPHKPTYDGESYFLFGINIGARYFFTENIGAYLELGYSGLQVANLGLAVKF